MPGTESHILHARLTGDPYRIDIAIPAGPAPAQGWPSIFLLDAAGCFATCVEALWRMDRRPDATGVQPTAVVGISFSDRQPDSPRRQRDFTSAGGKGYEGGGARAFLDFLEKEAKPLVAQRVQLDPARQTLFGHSLAGYFALWVLANQPMAFRNYAAISPSIWWDRDGLFETISSLAVRDRRVFLCIGEWEGALPPWQLAAPGSDGVMARREGRRMIGNATELAERLEAVLGGNHVRFALLPDEDHVSIISTAIPRALRMASAG